MFAYDDASERATSIEDYQSTCVNFILDISRDYKDWVDRYDLKEDEAALRKNAIDLIVNTTNNWIVKYGDTIKKVDIIMNDGVSKMAENTAGYPFSYFVTTNGSRRYVSHSTGRIKLKISAIPREGRSVKIGQYDKDNLFQLASSSEIRYSVSKDSLNNSDVLNDYIIIDASNCKIGDLISITIIVEELNVDYVSERRGLTTIILIK